MKLFLPALSAALSFAFLVIVIFTLGTRPQKQLEQADQDEAKSLERLEQAHQREIKSLRDSILIATQTGHLYGQRFILMKMNGGNCEPWSEEACLKHIRESFHLTNEIIAK